MAPIAKIFHNLPELSDDFRRLLKDLMDSAPDELPSTQVRVAADLTDTPYDEGLRRMAEYADTTTSREFAIPEAGSDILSVNPEREKKIASRLGRYLTDEEREKLGGGAAWGVPTTIEKYVLNPRRSALSSSKFMSMMRPGQFLYDNVYGVDKNTIEEMKSYFNINRDRAIEARKEFQRRMALEYLLEGLL